MEITGDRKGGDILKDGFGRTIDYLRISLTDKCNLRCRYCMPLEGVSFIPHGNILTFEEILRLVHLFTELGIRKIKVTGGEPLVRRGVKDLIVALHEVPGVEELTITTNGMKEELLMDLVPYFQGINLSLDSLKSRTFQEITAGGDLRIPLRVFRRLLSRGYPNLKVNMVPMAGINDDEVVDFAALAKFFPIKVRFIELMPIGLGRNFTAPTKEEITGKLTEAYGPIIPLSYRSNGPASYFTFSGFQGALGYIRGVDHHFCHECNRVRLTCEGFLKTCLGFSRGRDLRGLLRNGGTDEEIKGAILEAIQLKPRANAFDAEGVREEEFRRMYEIGG